MVWDPSTSSGAQTVRVTQDGLLSLSKHRIRPRGTEEN
jgi:hypothetical protein